MKGVPNASLITSMTPKGQQGGWKAQYGQVRIGTGGTSVGGRIEEKGSNSDPELAHRLD